MERTGASITFFLVLAGVILGVALVFGTGRFCCPVRRRRRSTPVCAVTRVHPAEPVGSECHDEPVIAAIVPVAVEG